VIVYIMMFDQVVSAVVIVRRVIWKECVNWAVVRGALAGICERYLGLGTIRTQIYYS